jgi:hypothetical protein
VRGRIQDYPVNTGNCQVPGEPLAPHPGYSFGAAAPQTTCWRQGLEGPPPGGTLSSAPLPPPKLRERSAVSPATHTVGGPGTTRPWPSHHPHPRVVRDTRRPPHRTSGIPYRSWGRVPARPHPRSPALNGVIEGSGILARGWRLRPWAPSSLSSDFLFLLPFLCLPGELRALALLGAPLLPLPSRTPPLSWLRGYGRAPIPAAPYSGEG